MEEIKNTGDDLNGEEATSKVVAPKGSESSILSVAVKKEKQKEIKSEPFTFRLNLYRSNGQVRMDIATAVIYQLSKDWGDLIKVIPSNMWVTVDELVQMVWEWEKKQFRKSFTRSRKQIEDGVAALREGGLLQEK